LAADGPLPLWKLLGIEVGARLVVLSACATLPPAGADRLGLALNAPLSLAEGLLLAGAEAVISSSTPVDDVSSALFMKRLHRQLLVSAPAEALRAAALAVRQRNPHPAWWASYSLLYGATAP
jgi:CHAT domain-containing protein